jgi:group I intron endonuclease
VLNIKVISLGKLNFLINKSINGFATVFAKQYKKNNLSIYMPMWISKDIFSHKKIVLGSTIYRPISSHAIFIWKTNLRNNIKKFSSSNLTTVTLSDYCKSEEITNFLEENNLDPILIYEDLNMETIKSRVLYETQNLSGIYLILNKITGDYYIGSASTGKLNSRFRNHLFNFNGSKIVKNAVKKYKIHSFAFMVLEVFPEMVTKQNNKDLLDLEDFYLKSLLPNYNILTEAGSSFGYKHTDICRIKMKASYNEELRMAIANLNKGKTFSPETLEAMKKAALNRKKPVYSEKAKINIKKNSKAIIVYNFDYTVFGEFPSIVEASKYLGCDQKTIRRALLNPKKILRRRWIIKYA